MVNSIKPIEINDVRGRILEAGRSEFARTGLSAASVRTIGERAGVTAAMINYYFGGKRALYDAVVAEAQERLFARIASAIATGGPEGLAARLAGAYFDFLAEDQELQRLLIREVLDAKETTRDLAQRYVQPLRDLFSQSFGTDEEAKHLAISLFGAIAGYFLYEPVLGAFLGADPNTSDSLARRRAHVLHLATQFEEIRR